MNVEVITDGADGDSGDLEDGLWQSVTQGDQPHPETVTVTLTQNPGEGTTNLINYKKIT